METKKANKIQPSHTRKTSTSKLTSQNKDSIYEIINNINLSSKQQKVLSILEKVEKQLPFDESIDSSSFTVNYLDEDDDSSLKDKNKHIELNFSDSSKSKNQNEDTEEISIGLKLSWPEKPINSTLKFSVWYHTIQPFMSQESEHHSLQYQQKIKKDLTSLNKFQQNIQTLETHFQKIQNYSNKFENLSKNYNGLVYNLLDEQQQLSLAIKQINQELKYFDLLTPIYQFLSLPGTDLCFDQRFLPNLTLLDEGIQFMKEHAHYKESSIYLMKYQQCLTRALSLIHLNLAERLERFDSIQLYNEVDLESNLMNNQSFNLTPLYNSQQKLRYLTSEFRPYLIQIEQRVNMNQAHHSLFEDCLQRYIEHREKELSLLINKLGYYYNLEALITEAPSLLELIIRDEKALIEKLFNLNLDSAFLLLMENFLKSLELKFYIIVEERFNKELKGKSEDNNLNENNKVDWLNIKLVLNELYLNLIDRKLVDQADKLRKVLELVQKLK